MAYDEAVRAITLDSDASIATYTGVPNQPGSADPNSGKQYRFVKVTGARTVGLCGAAEKTEVVAGVLYNKPQYTGNAATVVIRGLALVEAGAAVTAGDLVKTDADGQAVTATLPGDAGTVVGIATSGATAATHLISVLLKI